MNEEPIEEPVADDCSLRKLRLAWIQNGPGIPNHYVDMLKGNPPAGHPFPFQIEDSSGWLMSDILSGIYTKKKDGSCNPDTGCDATFKVKVRTHMGAYWKEISSIKQCNGQNNNEPLDPAQYGAGNGATVTDIIVKLDVDCHCTWYRNFGLFDANDQPIKQDNGFQATMWCHIICNKCPAECCEEPLPEE